MNKKLLTSKTKELQHGQSLAERLAIDRFPNLFIYAKPYRYTGWPKNRHTFCTP